ncbi:MAG: hypothetical protein SFV19_08120 [Rhodospirillaceae bacterium]|nr:hypothetical protein [Rhodospirillaceae bacterium]
MLSRFEGLVVIAQGYAQHAAFVTLMAAGGAAFGVLRVASSAQLAPLADRWTLPKYQSEQSATLDPEVLLSRFWSEQPLAPRKKAGPVETPPPAKPWQFLGTIDEGGKKYAVIEIEGKSIRQVVIGGQLPNGAVVTQIADGEMVFNREGADQTVRLFVESKSE